MYGSKKVEFRECRNGIGAFATVDISRNETITILTGELVSTSEMLRRTSDGRLRPDDPLQVREDLYLLADSNSLYFNHSCEPNSMIRGFNTLIGYRDISHGEEITFDYSTVVGTAPINSAWTMRCNCGAARCRKVIGSILTLPASILEEYCNAAAIPDFIISQIAQPGVPVDIYLRQSGGDGNQEGME